jgi:hypothetical protein
MRVLAALALLAVALSGCTTNCQELAHLACECVPAGTQRNNCEASFDAALKDRPTNEDFCASKLDSCQAVPEGSTFCEWIRTTDGKIACGYAYE